MNANFIWSSIIIDHLCKYGVEFACIGIGSRSTPLTLAAISHPDLTTYSFVDERSASYFALGIAKVTGKPTILICTTGTATANFYPAIVEAKYSYTPLIVLTADRPYELRKTGSNQTIDQVSIYGKMVNWDHDAKQPHLNPNFETLQYLVNTAFQAYSKSMQNIPGPVHLNFPFPKPLQPEDQNIDSQSLSEQLTKDITISQGDNIESKLNTDHKLFEEVKQMVKNGKVAIILGVNTAKYLDEKNLITFSQRHKIPILVDAASNFRYFQMGSMISNQLITTYDTFLQANIELPKPTLIIQFGEKIISKSLELYLQKIQSTIVRVHPFQLEIPRSHRFLCADLNEFILTLTKLDLRSDWCKKWFEIESSVKEYISSLPNTYEAYLFKKLFEISKTMNYFISNSLPIRHLDQFVSFEAKDFNIYTNRGVSGIDGNISTALGISASLQKQTILVIGDLAFLYDLNALLVLRRYKLPLKIIIVNNGGGAIFERLPIREYQDVFSDYFYHSHKISFSDISSLFGLIYQSTTGEELETILPEFLENDVSILEVFFKAMTTESTRKNILNEIIGLLMSNRRKE